MRSIMPSNNVTAAVILLGTVVFVGSLVAAIYGGITENDLLRTAARFPAALCNSDPNHFRLTTMKATQCVTASVSKRWDVAHHLEMIGAFTAAATVGASILINRWMRLD